MALSIRLDNHLLLRTVLDDRDKERFAEFNAIYNNPFEGATCACLLNYHPRTTMADYWLVEDQLSGEIVSTTCLIPWEGQFCGIQMRIAQLEMVLTRPDYRGRGLVRAQIEHFLQMVNERGYDLSIIWGIPYFYRQFGFSYSIEGEVFERLSIAYGHPPLVSNDGLIRSVFMTYPATVEEIPILASFHNHMIEGLGFSISRTPEYWIYLLQHARYPVEMVTDTRTGTKIGYIILKPSRLGDANHTMVLENYLPDMASSLEILNHLQERYQTEQAMGSLKIAWPQTTYLIQAARRLGSQVTRGSQWLMHITDLRRFLDKLAPVFEKRLAASHWRGAAGELVINLYRQAYRLRFEEGKFLPTEPLGFVDASMGADGGDLCIPRDAFIRLTTGFRGLDELFDAWPDIIVKTDSRSLIDTMFPRFPAYLLTPYHYLGK